MTDHRPVVFLDRDGTINEEAGYLYELEALRLLPDAAKSVCRLNQAGVTTVLVTNQSGPARGFFPESHVQALNLRLLELLAREGARLDSIYYCPHHVAGVVPEYSIACSCRKPATGMIDKAFQEIPNLDRQRAYMVGDQISDIGLAKNAQIRGVLVKTGHGENVLGGQYGPVQPDYVADSLSHAVDWILADLHGAADQAG